MLGDGPHRGFTGGGLDDLVSLAAQVELDQLRDVGLVVDDEDRAAVHTSSIVASGRRASMRIV